MLSGSKSKSKAPDFPKLEMASEAFIFLKGHGSNSSDDFFDSFLNKFFFWSIVTLECCVSFCFSAE